MTPLSRRSTNCRDRRFLNYWNATDRSRPRPQSTTTTRGRQRQLLLNLRHYSFRPASAAQSSRRTFFFLLEQTVTACYDGVSALWHAWSIFFFFAWSMMPNNISARSLNWLIRLNNWDDIYVGFFLCWWHLSWRSWIVVLLHMVAGCNQLQACITSVRVSGVTLIPTKNQASSRTG